MNKFKIFSFSLSNIFLIFIFLIPLTACAGMKDGGYDNQNERPQAKVIYLPNGKIIVKDGDGKVIPPSTPKFPIDVKQIENIETSVSITIRGSHYMLKKIGDRYYKIPLPH